LSYRRIHLSALRFHWLGVCFDVDDLTLVTIAAKSIDRQLLGQCAKSVI